MSLVRLLLFGLATAAAGACAGTVSDPEASAPVGAGPADSRGALPAKPGGPAMTPASDSKDSAKAVLPPTPPPVATAPGQCAVMRKLGPSPLRRLTHGEYESTVRDLLRLDTTPALGFPKEGEVGGLTNNVAQQTLTGSLIERYYLTAEKLAGKAVETLPKLSTCDVATKGEDTCAKLLIDDLGARAFRRPLNDEERASFAKVFTTTRTGTDFKNGARAIIESLLVAPQFLFRAEPAIGAPGAVVALDGWAVATRLSYFVWGSMPDDALFSAARNGKLGSPADIAAQVERMLTDGKARATIRRIYSEWLEFDRIEDIRKDAKKFPDFTPALQTAMRGELERFVDDVFEKKGGSLEALFTTSSSSVEGTLAKLYGVMGPTGSTFAPVELDATRRAGILTRAGLLASLSGEFETNLVHRGQFVRERILCQAVPPPPPDANAKAPAASTKLTTRERFAKHKEDPTCAGCHVLMDPIGLALETYDPIGRYRDTENNVPIDTTGELSDTKGGGSFTGAAEMGRLLAKSPTVQDCATTVWFRYAFGRTDTEADACTLGTLGVIPVSGWKARDLLVRLAQSDAFRFRTVSP